MRAGTGLAGVEFALLARCHATSRAANRLYFLESFLGHHGCRSCDSEEEKMVNLAQFQVSNIEQTR
jgi:hypothetical protein